MTVERDRRIKGFITGYLLEDGVLTLEQLDSALEHQLELTVQGRSLTLGDVLVEMGMVTREQLERVRARQWTEEVEPQMGRKGSDGQDQG